ncbi:MAG: BadF/BadG/BcrA/BcrD ATPase family protein [Cellulosilyticaceae bacterium]
MYLLGIDGGGTKTHCIIGDEEGNIYAEGFGGPSNYQVAGIETTQNSITTAIGRALGKLNITISDITYVSLGLAGADYEEDFVILGDMCKEIFKEVPFEIVNDCWIGLRAGSESGWGIVSICGTGHGTMGKGPDGNKVELRNMDYTLGNRGGGGELIREALHHTFRADEGIGPATRLQQEIPKVVGLETMTEVDNLIRNTDLDSEALYQIPVIVSELAKNEDEVAQEVMISMGKALGQTAAGVIRRLGIQKEEVPVILVGSVFAGDNPLLIDSYRLEVHKVAPKAVFKVLDKKPVLGAYYLALDYIKRVSKSA